MLNKLRFASSLAVLYVLTIGTIGGILYSSHLVADRAYAKPQPVSTHHIPVPHTPAISGKPVRIVIDTAAIDLPVDDGVYDSATQSWSLSDTHAQFAVMTKPANNKAGTTFIYGHGTDAVFGKIGSNPPPVGTATNIYTDNGHVFTYTLTNVKDYDPNDTSIFKDVASGPPQLIVQTCTGIFSEWRTMFTFTFDKVA